MVVRSWLPALVATCALLLAALPVHAAPDGTGTPPAPRPNFSYGAILNALDSAPLARAGGFTLISAYVGASYLTGGAPWLTYDV